jgi:antitoxin FitA
MPNVLVRDLPDDVHEQLQRRAAQAGQSLQQFLATELKRLAQRPSLEDVLGRIERRNGGRVGLEQAASDLAAERDDR